MKSDYTYCLNKRTCIHRRGCKRWIGNYSDKEVHKLYTICLFVTEVDETKCIPNLKDISCENDYHFLDRFRSSVGK